MTKKQTDRTETERERETREINEKLQQDKFSRSLKKEEPGE